MMKSLVEAMKEAEERIRDLPKEQWAEWIVYLMECLDGSSAESDEMLKSIDESLSERITNKRW